MPRALRRFFETEASGGIVLLVAAVVALAWVNLGWRDSYEALWHTELGIRLGDSLGLSLDLRHWVNEGLMAIFFFVVGLEIKREMVVGELRHWRTAALPALAAVGGMVVPAAIYLLITAPGPGARGWGIPMATDIAFALGVAVLLGRRVPSGLKLFLLTLAIVDDIGAIAVIAIFYAGELNPLGLAVAAALLAAVVALRKAGVTHVAVYVLVGVGVWLGIHASGVHATVAGVVLGLLTPARPLKPGLVVREWAESLSDDPTPAETADMTRMARQSVSVAERLEHRLHPLTSFAIVPLFALANAGVVLSGAGLGGPSSARVAAGVALGLVVGKPLGILAGAWLAVRTRLGALPDAVGWAELAGAGMLAGIGFTVSLFVSELAFADADLVAGAKIGVLAASAMASALGAAALVAARRARASSQGAPAAG
ncbi:MAG: Na+/H+ antiporter NhaA [Actinobacteria bacterium]|nr:Na+/H+ antiporter NhaA [Actinomycetota bacterium]